MRDQKITRSVVLHQHNNVVFRYYSVHVTIIILILVLLLNCCSTSLATKSRSYYSCFVSSSSSKSILLFEQKDFNNFCIDRRYISSFVLEKQAIKLSRKELSNNNDNRSRRTTTTTLHAGLFNNIFPKYVDKKKLEQDRRYYSSDREEQFPEQYPATYEINRNKVVGDFGELAIVRPLLKNTQLEKRPLQIVYDANNIFQGGWNAQAFHKAVDGKGAAIVLCKAGNRWYGGYNPKGWSSNGGARPSVAAFLFYQKSQFTSQIQKLRKIGGGGLACSKDDPTTGIYFGPDGLIIPLDNKKSPKIAYSSLGTYYERGPDQLYTIFPRGSAQLTELKVITGIYKKDEEIPYSGAVLDFTSG